MKLERVQTLLHVIYPSRCVGCGVLVEGDFGLCGSCWRETPFITGLSCDTCGVPLLGEDVGEFAHCDACLTASRPWEKGRSVLVYEGMARQLVLRLKHGDRTDMVRPAVGWMAGKARELRPDLRVIFISGYAEDSFRRNLTDLEFEFLPKPFSLNELTAKVKSAIESGPRI